MSDKNSYTLEIKLPWFATAGQARECGCVISDTIPDCAIYKPPGVFEWFSATIDIPEDQHE